MILLIDNYDSFSYNLYQLIGTVLMEGRNPSSDAVQEEVRGRIRVIRNDACTAEEIEAMHPEAVFLSPGPGRPEQAGICMDIVRAAARKEGGGLPVFGVCLGHQAICRALGGTVTYAKELMHGKQSALEIEPGSVLFSGLSSGLLAARYHSLSAKEDTLPEELRVTARSADGEVMAVEHGSRPIFGVQFHPESVMTPEGAKIVKNFLEAVRRPARA